MKTVDDSVDVSMCCLHHPAAMSAAMTIKTRPLSSLSAVTELLSAGHNYPS